MSAGAVAIWCGRSVVGDWGPWSLQETGIGGSEEAVVRLSRELVRVGWGVTVYATPAIAQAFTTASSGRTTRRSIPAASST